MDELINLLRKYIGMGVRDFRLEDEIQRKLKHMNLSISPQNVPDLDFLQKFIDLSHKYLKEFDSPALRTVYESMIPTKIKSIRSIFTFNPSDRGKKNPPLKVKDEIIGFNESTLGSFKYYFRFLNMGRHYTDYLLKMTIPNNIYERPIEYELFSDDYDPDECNDDTFFYGKIDVTSYSNNKYDNNLEFLLDPVNIENFIINLRNTGPMMYYAVDSDHPQYGILPFLPDIIENS
jgi:hypothetical protein